MRREQHAEGKITAAEQQCQFTAALSLSCSFRRSVVILFRDSDGATTGRDVRAPSCSARVIHAWAAARAPGADRKERMQRLWLARGPRSVGGVQLQEERGACSRSHKPNRLTHETVEAGSMGEDQECMTSTVNDHSK